MVNVSSFNIYRHDHDRDGRVYIYIRDDFKVVFIDILMAILLSAILQITWSSNKHTQICPSKQTQSMHICLHKPVFTLSDAKDNLLAWDNKFGKSIMNVKLAYVN